MIEVVKDIETLETALIYINEGASDEKRAGISMLQKMLDSKKEELQLFEDTMAPLIPELKSDVEIDQNKFDEVEFRKAV
ncbi:MAG: hypothetical protein CMA64_00205 [Euryarchaeota archaeon]|jgi:hypothetical protein|nr:hypothetical protein [Euryarchaeota archaeon]